MTRLDWRTMTPEEVRAAEASPRTWLQAFPWQGVPPEILAAVRGLPPGAVDSAAGVPMYEEPGIKSDGMFVPPGFRMLRIHDTVSIERYTYADACVDAARGRYMKEVTRFANAHYSSPLDYMRSDHGKRCKAIFHLTEWRFRERDIGASPHGKRAAWLVLPAEVRANTAEAVRVSRRVQSHGFPHVRGRRVLELVTHAMQVHLLQRLGVHVFGSVGTSKRALCYIVSPSALAYDLGGVRGFAVAPPGHVWIRTENKGRLALRSAFERVRVSLADVAAGVYS